MNKLRKAKNHFKLICIHKWNVFKYCCKAHLFIRGIKHDMSKFSPVEFFESAKYYTGICSPIDECKAINGYSKAWLHHKGKNSHHYEYWQDNFDNGGEPIKMPYKEATELVCDYLGAGRAYMREGFSYLDEYNWWKNKIKNPLAMHPQTKAYVETMLYTMKKENSCDCLRPSRSEYIYNLTNKLNEAL